MSAPIKTITTPFGNHAVGIKEWITGKEREYIEGSFLSGVDAKPRMQGKEMTMDVQKMDLERLTNESKHRAIQTFVVSIDGKTENIVDEVLGMHEDDTDFILASIDETSKKKGTLTT